jgi:endonuclease/exonuclease/phosphatase (EEP) superfamily protein YafD
MSWTEAGRFILFLTGYAFIVFSLIPLIRSNYWYVRIFDYPRSQKFWVSIGVFCAFLPLADWSQNHDKLFLVALFLNITYLLTQIWDYTPLASHQMKMNTAADAKSIRIFIANVFQENQQYERCCRLISQYDPHIVLLVETDDLWHKQIDTILKDYPYQVIQPQDNTYGMLLYSRLEIVNHSVRFLVEKDIPSIVADVKGEDGQIFRLYCLHPKPPVPNESEESTDRDAEILMVGKEANKCNLPVIVAGDLNDVAWSYTTNLFLKVSGLLDPRIGRGFFSTFHAAYRLFRWPLDHVFCSSHFYLFDLKRLPSIGSDHFPIFIEVGLMPYEVKENEDEVKEAEPEDIQVANEKIQEAKV